MDEGIRQFFEREGRDPWEDNRIQFPRLLCEIMATQDGLDLEILAESMDLEIADVNELFDRAHNQWEHIKEITRRRRL